MNNEHAPGTAEAKAPSLYQYLDAALKANVSHLSIGLNRESDGGIHFYIHPSHVSGATEDYLIWPDPFEDNGDLLGNRKNLPMPDVKGFLEKLRADQLKAAHTPEPALPAVEAAAREIHDLCTTRAGFRPHETLQPAFAAIITRHLAPGLQCGVDALADAKAEADNLREELRKWQLIEGNLQASCKRMAAQIEEMKSAPPPQNEAGTADRENIAQQFSPIVVKTIECLASELRRNVGIIDSPAMCVRCGFKTHAPTTGKVLSQCTECYGEMKTIPASAPTPTLRDTVERAPFTAKEATGAVADSHESLAKIPGKIGATGEAEDTQRLDKLNHYLWHGTTFRRLAISPMMTRFSLLRARKDNAPGEYVDSQGRTLRELADNLNEIPNE